MSYVISTSLEGLSALIGRTDKAVLPHIHLEAVIADVTLDRGSDDAAVTWVGYQSELGQIRDDTNAVIIDAAIKPTANVSASGAERLSLAQAYEQTQTFVTEASLRKKNSEDVTNYMDSLFDNDTANYDDKTPISDDDGLGADFMQ